VARRGGGGHRSGGAQVGEGGGPVEWAAAGSLPWAGPKRTVPFCNQSRIFKPNQTSNDSWSYVAPKISNKI
jgi:hypothetical protein